MYELVKVYKRIKPGTDHADVPKIFHPNNTKIENFTKNLMSNSGFIDQLTINKIMAYKALGLWNNTQYSEGLTHIAMVSNLGMQNFHLNFTFLKNDISSLMQVLDFMMKEFENAETRTDLGKHAILVFSIILKTIVSENLQPAVKFMDVLMDKISVKIPLVPYVISTIYQTNEIFKPKSQEISEMYPSIEKLQKYNGKKAKYANKFEIAITKDSDDDESKQFAIQNFLRTIDVSLFIENVSSHHKVLVNMLDITVCELMKGNS